jgi:hypothetical protein
MLAHQPPRGGGSLGELARVDVTAARHAVDVSVLVPGRSAPVERLAFALGEAFGGLVALRHHPQPNRFLRPCGAVDATIALAAERQPVLTGPAEAPFAMHLKFTNLRIIESTDELEGDEEAQLAEAARRADGAEFPAAMRLDPDHPASIAGGPVELWDIVDDSEEPIYRAWFFGESHGSVFDVATTDVVGDVVQFSFTAPEDHELWRALAEAHAEASAEEPDSELARMDFSFDEEA